MICETPNGGGAKKAVHATSAVVRQRNTITARGGGQAVLLSGEAEFASGTDGY